MSSPAAKRDRRARPESAAGGNELLENLSPINGKRIRRQLVRVRMDLGEVVYQANQPIVHVYFPDTAVLSFIVGLSDGPSVEAAMSGAEGMSGVSVLGRSGSSNTRCIVQVAGDAQRLTAAAFRRLMKTMPQFTDFVQRYVVAYVEQVSQTAACNRRHSVSQRCARWLLMTHDRVNGAATFSLTHAFLAHMLGSRREAVTVAAQAFQRNALISYSRGRVTIVNRLGLEAASCECHGIVARRLHRLYG
jgi:CRP-like cAMP-binding protein